MNTKILGLMAITMVALAMAAKALSPGLLLPNEFP